MRSLESAPGRVWTAWRSPGRFTKNPDMVALPDGRLLAVYADIDQHWAEGLIRLTLIQSRDRGATWEHAGIVAESDRSKREPHWVTPRLSYLSDGRLAVICDRDDYEHCHEYQPAGNYLWWSEDLGKTWSEPVNTGIPGIEPDRLVELPGGRLAVGAHMTYAETQKLGQFVCLSDDGGRTWGPPIVIAKDHVHSYCDGAIVPLRNGSLVCVMRDNVHGNYPSQVSFSFDNGLRWTEPVEAPFSGDRPFAGQLPDGRLLVTYRNQGGNKGTYAWLGDIGQDLGYRVSALHKGPEEIALSAEDGLHIRHAGPATTQYNLLPLESYRSEALFEATLRVNGSEDDNCALIQIARIGVRLHVRTDGLWIGEAGARQPRRIDRHWPADMTEWHTVRIHHRGGLLRYSLDGQEVMRNHVTYEMLPVLPGGTRTFFGTDTASTGEAWWRDVTYSVRNTTEPDHLWAWSPASGFPDQYETDRILELHANTHERADNGYSTWHQFSDGEILVLDYTNQGDPHGQSHVVACRLRAEDFETMGRHVPAQPVQ
jgi:hypothetical protein